VESCVGWGNKSSQWTVRPTSTEVPYVPWLAMHRAWKSTLLTRRPTQLRVHWANRNKLWNPKSYCCVLTPVAAVALWNFQFPYLFTFEDTLQFVKSTNLQPHFSKFSSQNKVTYNHCLGSEVNNYYKTLTSCQNSRKHEEKSKAAALSVSNDTSEHVVRNSTRQMSHTLFVKVLLGRIVLFVTSTAL